MIAKLLRYKKIILIALSVLLLLIIISLYLLQKKPSITPSSSVSPTPDMSEFSVMPKALTVDQIPRIPDEQGGGLDTDSIVLKNSIAQLNNLKQNFPYQKIFTTKQGYGVEIFIPPADLQENEWTLTVHIFGIDYQVPEDSKEYQTMRLSFLEAARDAINFIQTHDGNVEQILIKWGDRYFIQDRAQEWLNSIDS